MILLNSPFHNVIHFTMFNSGDLLEHTTVTIKSLYMVVIVRENGDMICSYLDNGSECFTMVDYDIKRDTENGSLVFKSSIMNPSTQYVAEMDDFVFKFSRNFEAMAMSNMRNDNRYQIGDSVMTIFGKIIHIGRNNSRNSHDGLWYYCDSKRVGYMPSKSTIDAETFAPIELSTIESDFDRRLAHDTLRIILDGIRCAKRNKPFRPKPHATGSLMSDRKRKFDVFGASHGNGKRMRLH